MKMSDTGEFMGDYRLSQLTEKTSNLIEKITRAMKGRSNTLRGETPRNFKW